MVGGRGLRVGSLHRLFKHCKEDDDSRSEVWFPRARVLDPKARALDRGEKALGRREL